MTIDLSRSEHDARAVEPHVYAAVRIAQFLVERLRICGADLLPARRPVLRVLPVPRAHVAHHLRVVALRGDGRKARVEERVDVVREERLRVQGADELAGPYAVAVVHQPSEDVAEADRLLRAARRDDAGVVRLDLVVDVVRALVEPRMRTVGRRDAAPKVVPSGAVRAPELVLGVREVDAGLPDGRVEAMVLQRLQEGHLHVEVVVAVRHAEREVARPLRHLVRGDDRVFPLELRRLAPRHAHHLPHPRGLHLVAVVVKRERPHRIRTRRRNARTNGKCRYDHCLFHLFSFIGRDTPRCATARCGW